ncbi:MAG: hypothetical protein ACRDL7_13040, partial [Gaiellaceae bacterium]
GWTKPGDPIPAAAGDWQQGGSPRNLTGGGSPYVDDVFGDWVVGTQTISPSAAPGSVGTLANGPLSTTVNTTHLDLQAALTKTVTSGDSLVLSASGKTITFVASATASPGATTISVTGKKSNFGYPNGTTINDTTAQKGDYARQATLPAQNSWTLGPGSDPLIGTTFAALGDEHYGTELRWNASGLKAYTPAATVGNGSYDALQAGTYYKVQILEKDGDQNKGLGGDTGEFCTIIKIPGPPQITSVETPTDSNGTQIVGSSTSGVDNGTSGTPFKLAIGTYIKDSVSIPANAGFPNPTGRVGFKLFTSPDSGCTATNLAGGLYFTDDSAGSPRTLSNANPAVASSGAVQLNGTAGQTFYWKDHFYS